MIKVSDVIKAAEKLAPTYLACDWDNIGLQIGNKSEPVNNILISLDVNEKIINEALNEKCQLIISHHPFIFKPLNKINGDNDKGKQIYKAIINNLNVYSMHTNLDIAKNGLNDYLAKILGINNIKFLKLTTERELYKLVVFIPVEHFEDVKAGILASGAGYIGNYSHTSFSIRGKGSFKPLKGSTPYLGKKNKLNIVDEYRFETIVKKSDIKGVLEVMYDRHPYEEVAYDLYPLQESSEKYGLGRIGFLQNKMLFSKYLKIVQERLNIKQLKYVGKIDSKIKNIAICSGSGAELIPLAAQKGADILITSDIKYHEAQMAESYGIGLIDAGHYNTEIVVKSLLYKYFTSEINGVKIIKSKINTDPWNYI